MRANTGLHRGMGLFAGFSGALIVALLWGGATVAGAQDIPRFFQAFSNDAVTGSATLTKAGAGTLTLYSPIPAANTFNGNIVVDVDGGTLKLSGLPGAVTSQQMGATLPGMTSANTITVKRGGTFYIEDNATANFAGYATNRLGTEGSRPGMVLDGGTFTFNGVGATLVTTQSVGTLTLSSGPSTVTVTRNNAASTNNLYFSDLVQNKGAFVNFTGTALGTGTNDGRIIFTTTPSAYLVGGVGGPGTTTKKTLMRSRSGNDLVALNGTFGVSPLVFAEYNQPVGNDINGAGATENVKIGYPAPTALVALSAGRTINALVITNGATWAMGNTLTLTSGQLITTPSLTISSGTLTAGSGSDIDMDITPTAGTLTLTGATIADNGSGKITLVKNGGGTITLSSTADNTFSGGTYINEGAISTTGTTANRRFFGSGPVRVDNALLVMTAIGSTSYSGGDDYTAINGGQVSIANLGYTSDDTFNIGAGSVIQGGTGTGTGLNSLERGVNITLAADAVVAHPALTAALNPTTGTIKSLGADADLYYGLGAPQANTNGSITIGTGTPFKGVSTDRSARSWQLGTVNVAAGTSHIYFQGLALPGAVPATLTKGNGVAYGGQDISLAAAGTVNAHLLGYVTMDGDSARFGDTSAGQNINFVVERNAQVTLNQRGAWGSGTGVATAEVNDGGTLMMNNPGGINGATTVHAGGRLLANNVGGLTGTGTLTFEEGAILDVATAVAGFSGVQASNATVAAGTVVRLGVNGFGTASNPLDSYLADKSPIYELTGANWAANPLVKGTTIMTLNKDGSGKGGMLVNANATVNTLTSAANGVLVIGPNGGTIAATTNTTLAVPQPIALGANALTIGSTEQIDRVFLPKTGVVQLNALWGYNTASAGSSITVIPNAMLQNAANSIPDAADVVVNGIFHVVAADTIGSLAGTGTVNLATALTVGRNNNSKTFDGVLLGGQALAKTGTGRQDLTGGTTNLTHTGAINVNQGTLALSKNGKFSNNTGTITLNTGGTLSLDNTDLLVTGRIGTKAITMANGTLTLVGNPSAATTETVGAVTPGQGDSTISVSGGTAGNTATLRLTSGAARAGGGILRFSGMNADNVIMYVTAPAMTDAILPYGFVGSNFAVTSNNIPIYAYSAYTTGDLGTATVGGTLNFSLTTDPQTAVTANKTINSLKMTGGLGVTITGGAIALTVDTGSIINDGGGNITGTGTLAAGAQVLTVLNTGAMTIDSLMTGSGGLAKLGDGTLTIGKTNALAGTSYVLGGTLAYGVNDALYTQDVVVDAGSTLDFATFNDTNLGSVTVKNGQIVCTGASAANNIAQAASKNITLGGGPSGSSASINTGSGKWTMAGTAGTITFDANNDPDMATIAGNLALGTIARTFTVNNSVGSGAAIDLDVPAVITGTAAVTKQGAGVMRLSGDNSFDGNVTNAAGTLIITRTSALGTPSTVRTNTVSSGATLALDNTPSGTDIALSVNRVFNINGGGDTLLGPISGALVNVAGNNNSAAGAVTLAGASTIASLAGKLTLSGKITGTQNLTIAGEGDVDLTDVLGIGTGTLTKNGRGTLTISGSGANTLTGATTINAGTVVLGKTGGVAASATTAITINNGATLQYGSGTANALATPTVAINGAGLLDMNGATDTIGNMTIVATTATGHQTVFSNTAGGGTLTIGTLGIQPVGGYLTTLDSGTGTLKLGGNLTFTPVTTGQAKISGNLDLGAATRTIATGNWAGATDYELEIDAVITGTAGVGITKTGSGALRLSNANTFDGVVAFGATTSGSIILAHEQALGTPSTARTMNFNFTGVTLALDGVGISDPNNRITLQLNGTGDTRKGMVTGTGISGALASLRGNNTVPCAILLSAATQIASYSAGEKLTLTGNITGANLGLTVVGDGDTELKGTLAFGTAGLTKNGNGVLTLTGTNTYTGATTINAGILRAAGEGTLTNSAVTVANGGTLSPGVYGAAGTTVWTKALVLASNSVVNFECTTGANDKLCAIGNLTLTYGAGVRLYDQGTTDPWTGNGFFQLIRYTGTLTGAATNLTVLNPVEGKTYAFLASGGWIYLSVSSPLTWDGGSTADDFWKTADNWNPNEQPTENTLLVFSGTDGLANTNNYDPNTRMAGILFDETAGAFVLAGSTLNLLGDVVNNSAYEQAINGDLVLDSASRTFNTASNNITVNGAITESPAGQGIVKLGTNMLTLAGANSYSGQTLVKEGSVRVTNPTGLGTTAGGTFVTNGAALQLAGDIAIGACPLRLDGTGVNDDGALRNISGVNSWAGAVTLGSTGVKIVSDSGTLTLGGIISGTGYRLEVGKDGGGTLILSAANSFTGGLTLNGGTLRATTVTGALGAGGLLLNGGQLELANDANLAFNRNTTNTAPVTIVSDRFTGPGAGTTHTLGTLTNSAATLTIKGGDLVDSGTAGVTFGTTSLDVAPTLNIVNPTLGGVTLLTLGAATLNEKTITVTGNGNLAQGGVWAAGTGGGGVVLDENFTGVVTLGSANTFTGGLTIKRGTFVANVSNSSTVSGAAGPSTYAITLGDAAGSDAYLLANSNFVVSNPINLGTGAAGALTIGKNGGTISCTFSGPISLNGNTVTIAATGTSGTTTIGGGITGVGNVVLSNAGTGATAITLSGVAAPIDNSGTISTVDSTGLGLTTISAPVGANVTAINQGSASSWLTVSGTLTVNAGGTTISTTSKNALTQITGSVGGSGNLILSADNAEGTNGITVATGAVTNIGEVANVGSGTGNVIISAQIGANVARVSQLSSTSTLILSGNNLFTGGVLIFDGTVRLGHANGLGPNAAGNVTFNTGAAGTLQLNGYSPTIVGLSSDGGTPVVENGHATTAVTLTVSNLTDNVFDGTLQDGSTARLSLTKKNSGRLTLSGLNTYTGVNTLNAGTLSVAFLDNGDLPSGLGQSSAAAANLVFSGGTLEYTGGSVASDRNYTLAAYTTNTISVTDGGAELTLTGGNPGGNNSGTLVKDGAGTLTLAGTNLHVRGTVVTNGTLKVTGSLASRVDVYGGTLQVAGALSASVPVTVWGGGTMASANGTCTGLVTVAEGGTLALSTDAAPGGTLAAGRMTLDAGSTNVFRFSATTNDTIAVTASAGLTIRGGAQVRLYDGATSAPWAERGLYYLIQYSNSLAAASSATNLTVVDPQPNTVYRFGTENGWVVLMIGKSGQSWDGGGADGNWLTGDNWNPDGAPSTNDLLSFIGPLQPGNTNDFDVNTRFAGISFDSLGTETFRLSGNRVYLAGDVANNMPTLQTLAMPLQLLWADRVFDTAEGDLLVSGIVRDGSTAAGIIKQGANVLTLSAANAFKGPVVVNAGTLDLSGSLSKTTTVTVADGAILTGAGTAAGSVTMQSGSTLRAGTDGVIGSMPTFGNLQLDAGSASAFEFEDELDFANDKVKVRTNLTIAAGAGIYLYQGGTTDPWMQEGLYTLMYYTNMTGDADSLVMLNPQPGRTYAFGGASNTVKVMIGSSGKVWDGGSAENNYWSTGENWNPDGKPDWYSVVSFGGSSRLETTNDMAAETWLGGLKFEGDAGPFTLSGNRFTFAGTIVNDSLNVQTINMPLSINLSSCTFNTATNDIVVNGAIDDDGVTLGLNKTGSNMLTLAGANTYKGVTAIREGTLKLTGSMTAGSSKVGILSGTKLTGTGLVAGTVTNFSGGTLAPGLDGTAGGRLSMGRLVLNTGSAVEFEFSSTTNDALCVTNSGGLTINTGTSLYLYEQGTQNAWTNSGVYRLIRYDGTLNGSVANLSVANPDPNNVYTFGTASGWVVMMVSGAALVWDGDSEALSGNCRWSSPTNWAGDAPLLACAHIEFGGSAGLVNTNDTTAYTTYGNIVFNATAGAFSLKGNAFTLAGNVENDSVSAQTFYLSMMLDWGSRTFTVPSGMGDITMRGALLEGGNTNGIVKAGPGTLTLAGTNTYLGNTTISGGTLNVMGKLASASTVSVARATVLTGTGTCAGSVTNSQGGTIAPGVANVAGGQLTVGSLLLGNGCTNSFEFSVTTNDTISVTNNSGLAVAATTYVYLYDTAGQTWAENGVYTLIRHNGPIVGSPLNFAVRNTVAGKTYLFADTGDAITLTISGGRMVWDGGEMDSDNWMGANNWMSDTQPQALDTLTFVGEVRQYPVNDYPDRTRFGGIVFADYYTNALGQTVTNLATAFVLSEAGDGYDHRVALVGDVVNNSTNNAQEINLRLTLDSGNRTFNAASNNLTVSRPIDDNGQGLGIIKTGANTLTLSAANTYTGPTLIKGGTLAYNGDDRIASGAVILDAASAKLDMGAYSDAVGAVVLSNGLISGAGVLSATSMLVANGTADVVIAGSGGLYKTNAANPNVLVVTRTNTYEGITVLKSGKIRMESDGRLGTNDILMYDGVTLEFARGGSFTNLARVRGAPGGNTGGGDYNTPYTTDGFGGGYIRTVTEGMTMVLESVAGYRGSISLGSNSTVFVGNDTPSGNSFVGWAIYPAAIPGVYPAHPYFPGMTMMEAATPGSLLVLNFSDTFTVYGEDSLGHYGGPTQQGDIRWAGSGQMVVAGSWCYKKPFWIDRGTVVFGGPYPVSDGYQTDYAGGWLRHDEGAQYTGPSPIYNEGTIEYRRGLTTNSLGSIGPYSYNGKITGSGRFVYSGYLTMVNAGTNNDYTGGTIVSNGGVRVCNGSGFATGLGETRVLTGAELSGTGRVATVHIEAGGIIDPGGSQTYGLETVIGVLTTSNLVMDAGSLLNVDLVTTNAWEYDSVYVDGDASVAGTVNVSSGRLRLGTYVLMSASGTITDNGLTMGPLPDGVLYNWHVGEVFPDTGLSSAWLEITYIPPDVPGSTFGIR